MTERIHNFGAGPGVLPESVLRQAQQDIWNIGGSGMGVAEHSHRGKLFEKIITDAEEEARQLAGIPDNYKVIFMQGGASQQFAMVPMNLLPAGETADYLVTGVWSEKAVQEAAKFGATHVAVSAAGSKFTRIPDVAEIAYSSAPAYVHITTNNTIYGTQWSELPPVPEGVPLIADTSSDMFSRPLDVSKYGLIYAGAQKNLGPSGVVMAIIRDDLADRAPASLPTMLQYRTYVKERSLYNTPPTFAIYMVGLVLKWIRETGGLGAMAERNAEKAALLYDFLDQSTLFRTPVHADSRSHMNVVFRSASDELDSKFLAEAGKRGMEGLKGHRSAGGIRASIYNACPRESVVALVDFMKEFELANR
ncbi:MAG: 3-phosphoserine/phosphohydroxythreonine transaminase [Gemmatimonadales bacterium]|nr:3-phosphoserine/phosphohydroxythreonine transaminase [Gemmatimonadales bacterium]MBP6569838.1 3-phosphoserine/phosphohydroxythreonine transaminase [Gemmatimonadales bacterium]MBP7622229.1 3-phosphoserine/phosphohydroxythreonine transaminase [Gemmatimonadales bacterium]MBP9897562.1 3-phosphoserine/phosphohydroxythreonine transaminase [Gemmatimonadales bacterium]